jgi:2',3'-cyclic-nucleotide 2'-phosphodiesterase (5'-nucleotidase family)
MLAGLLWVVPALAQKKITLLVTGDNGGEITTCGCSSNPSGGLAKRKAVFDEAARKGPSLALDAGNALFGASVDAASSKKRAAFILETMGKMGTVAMAVGASDLEAGLDFLKRSASQSTVRLLSANLRDEKGKAIFEPTWSGEVGGLRVGVVGVTPSALPASAKGLVAVSPVGQALSAAKGLRPRVDLLIVLAPLPFPQAVEISEKGKAWVDIVIQSGENRAPVPSQNAGGALLVGAGDRGRNVGQLSLTMKAGQPFMDLGEVAREQQTLSFLNKQIDEARARFADPKEQAQAVTSLEERRNQVAAKVAEAQARGRAASTYKVESINLGQDVPSDPTIWAQVQKYLVGN